jgi:L-seryl-tRNA(Ser) seleniumtransferase
LFRGFGRAAAAWSLPVAAAKKDSGDVYRRLGVRTFINCVGTRTIVTGSVMAPEVARAMQEASRHHVSLQELLDKAGERIAELTGAEAALVTAGACAAMTAAAAGCITGTDKSRIARLPDTTGLKNEIVIQRPHNDEAKAGGSRGYMRSLLVPGTRFVEVETRAELEAAINDRTALMHFVNYCEPFSTIGREEWASFGRKRDVPTLVDAAADVPPRGRIREWLRMFDLVAISGGKGMRGPQCAGLLLGRKDLVKAAGMNLCPNVFTIGRGFKVGKEEIVGMVAAVERFYRIDEAAEEREWRRRVETVERALRGLKGIRTEIRTPPEANVYPVVHVSWDSRALGFDAAALGYKPVAHDPVVVIAGEPAIAIQSTSSGFRVNSFPMQAGDVEVVARRLRQALETAIRKHSSPAG